MPYAADYFVRPTNGNDGNAGTSYAQAWKTLQKALDTVAAGKVCGCCAEADEVIAASIDDDTQSGGVATPIKFIGLNAAGDLDGTRYCVNANSAAANCIAMNGRVYKSYRNFEFKNATGAGFNFVTTISNAGIALINCISHNNGTGLDTAIASANCNFYQCQFYSNSSHGIANTTVGLFRFIKCSIFLNGGSGISGGTSTSSLINCLIYKNTVNGITSTNNLPVIVGCVIDGNVIGIAATTPTTINAFVLFCRITNNSSFAIQVTTGQVREDFNFYNGNAAKFSQTTGLVVSGLNSVDMASDGYVNRAANNYALVNGASPAEGRWVALALDATNTDYFSAGMQPNPDFPTAANVYNTDSTDGVTGTAVPSAAPSKPSITARIWGSGKIRVDWTASSDTATYTVKRGGAPIATGLIDTTFYLDTGLSAGSYIYIVSAVGSSTVDSDPVTVTASITDAEATLWAAFKDVMSNNVALSAATTTYAYTRLEPGYVSGDSQLFKAWPYISDPNSTKLSLTIAIQARIYGTTVTMEDSLMTYIKLIREAVDTLSGLYPLLETEILDDTNIECCKAVDSGFNEAYMEVKVSVK